MQEELLGSVPLRFKDPRREAVLEPEEVSAILRLSELGWGSQTDFPGARDRPQYGEGIHRGGRLDAIPAAAAQELDGQKAWLRERLRRHRGNADVIRQELAKEKGIVVSLRTVERAVERYRQELSAEARATVRFETPGKQLQTDFGERLVEIGGSKVRAYLFVATLGYALLQAAVDGGADPLLFSTQADLPQGGLSVRFGLLC
jgi:hypothetical protein